MDRKGINSGKCSAICAIKEKLDKLWDRTHNAFSRLNGVEGDGTGNLQIEAGSGISLSQSGNRILINTEEQLPYSGVSPIQIDPDSREVSLLMDDTPTANSGRAVKSGGVFAAVDTVDNKITDIITGTQTVGRAALADTADALNGILPINNGGTGSNVKNFVDLSTNQEISGQKQFTGQFRLKSNSVIPGEGSPASLTGIDLIGADGQIYGTFACRWVNNAAGTTEPGALVELRGRWAGTYSLPTFQVCRTSGGTAAIYASGTNGTVRIV